MISIICPVYNTEKYLCACAQSILSQGFKDWELLLIDDGSTDNSPSICDNFSKIDKRIRTFHKQNQGQWLTREFGIEKSKGDHFIFLDSDDVLENDALQTINKYIEKYDSDVYLYDICKLNPDNSKTCLQELYEQKSLSGTKDIIDYCFVKNNCISLCVYCFKKTFYLSCSTESTLRKDVRSQEDFLMLFNILQQSNELIVIPKVLYIYRTNNESASSTLVANDYFENVLISSYIYKTIFDKYNNDLSTYSIKIKRRLSWQPVSFIKRAYKDLSSKQQKKSFRIVKKSFIYNEFTKKYRFESKKDRLLLLFFRMNLHLFNRVFLSKS